MTQPKTQFAKAMRLVLRGTRRRFGKNLHEARLKKEMTLPHLSEESGVSLKVLERVEIGKGELTIYQINRLACALLKDPADLFK